VAADSIYIKNGGEAEGLATLNSELTNEPVPAESRSAWLNHFREEQRWQAPHVLVLNPVRAGPLLYQKEKEMSYLELQNSNENNRNNDKQDTEDVANISSVHFGRDDPLTEQKQGKGRVTRVVSAILSAPYLVTNTALNVAAGIAVIGILMAGGVAGYTDRLMSGDPVALILTLVTFTALLSGTMGLALLADKREAIKRNERFEARNARNDQAHTQLMTAVREVLQVQQEVSDAVHMVFAQSNATWYRRKNCATSWNAIAAGTELVSIDGFCLAEATETRDAHGNVMFRANVEMLQAAWMPRFHGPTKLSKVTHMIGVKSDTDDVAFAHGKLLKLIGVYRALQEIAHKSGHQIDLSTVEIVLFDASHWTLGPTFLGVKKSRASNREQHAFVQRYTDIALSAANILNTGVEVSYSNELVGHYKSVASELMGNAQRVLNLEEAEKLFGRYVPKFAGSTNAPITLETRQRRFEVIDHMDGSFSMGDYLI